MCHMEFHLKVSKLYLNMSLVSINIIIDPLSPTISTQNIPDCPFFFKNWSKIVEQNSFLFKQSLEKCI